MPENGYCKKMGVGEFLGRGWRAESGRVIRNTGIFGNDVFSKHLFPMVSYTQNTHKIPIPSNPRSTLLPSPLPKSLQPV